MSVLHQKLSQSDLRLEQEEPALIPTPLAKEFLQRSSMAMKISVASCLIMSVAALGGLLFLSHFLGQEAYKRNSSDLTLKEQVTALNEVALSREKELALIKNDVNTLKDIQNDTQSWRERTDEQIASHDTQITLLKDDTQKSLQSVAFLQDRMAEIHAKVIVSQQTPSLETPGKKTLSGKGGASRPAKVQKPVVKRPIVSINREFSFVVFNNEDNAFSPNDLLTVIRSGQPIGLVQIEKTYDGFSAAKILKESPETPLRDGDILQTSL